MSQEQHDSGSPSVPVRQPASRQRVELYAEENFAGANLQRSVHVGWGVCLGAVAIFACMGASAVTQSRSWNVSFRWLQRRVGIQFGTLTYLITTNTLYYHDGDKWVTRDWASLADKFNGTKRATMASSTTGGISQGFAANAV
mmetsp:Transcript_22628/g.38569  ORF Transcript_22628/g.38569 Transcript_22628/m.38569 type:complete len:142 (-) Transcript_22628:760-1185(-)|eukprot:CAMPEP_0119102858 /NCGR_PEP_ID=MMETSP1180-20130426/1464_1 /TAXON_ID=3052 ORGANISM="Chlamydomonas cf sp, Strain CCMP681" /NCGR_SAMPLE_ID=MMETSP1180 /ASSEMBLY_ACC=CAM_ASM_000741 /LENGTH=141 /DNA_ID=CAMNT_0007087229 /DNA_START=238 /DNA_END=663 /DNA_ORIENTATION=+